MNPTNRQKNRLINILISIKTEGRLEENIYKKFLNVPNRNEFTKTIWASKDSQEKHPLGLIVSSRGSLTYGVAKELARILKPLTGNTIHHVNISMEFADNIKKIKLEEGECIISYHVPALFTSIPVKSAIEVTKKKLEQDTELHQRTSMSIHNILELLGWSFVCVTPTSCPKVSFMSKPRGQLWGLL